MARGWGASSSSGGSGARHHGAIDRARVEAEDERAPTRPHHNPTDANTHTHTLTYSRRPSRHAGDKSTPCAAHASSSRRENRERGPSPFLVTRAQMLALRCRAVRAGTRPAPRNRTHAPVSLISGACRGATRRSVIASEKGAAASGDAADAAASTAPAALPPPPAAPLPRDNDNQNHRRALGRLALLFVAAAAVLATASLAAPEAAMAAGKKAAALAAAEPESGLSR